MSCDFDYEWEEDQITETRICEAMMTRLMFAIWRVQDEAGEFIEFHPQYAKRILKKCIDMCDKHLKKE